MNLRRKVFLVLMLVMMVCIFLFSSRTSVDSTEDSYYVGRLVSELFVPDFDEWSAEDQQAFIEKIDHPVRKTAHATEYAVLAMLSGITNWYRPDGPLSEEEICRDYTRLALAAVIDPLEAALAAQA